MPRHSSLILLSWAALLSTTYAQKAPVTAPPGDVFSTQGAREDRRKYVRKDGRSFDRCAYETDHMGDNPYTKQYGPPDHVPIGQTYREISELAAGANPKRYGDFDLPLRPK